MGMAGAYLYWELHVSSGWPFFAAALAGVAFSAGIGVATNLLLMRRLRRASPLARVVATLGVLIVLQSIAVLRYGSRPTVVPAELPTSAVHLLGVTISLDRLLLVGIAIVLTFALMALYRFTRLGIVTSAVAENERVAASAGMSPGAVASLNWGLGAGLAGLAAILVSPVISLQPATMTTLVLAALAAALVADFRSFPLALLAGLLIGVGQSELSEYVNTTGLSTSLPFFVIVAVVLARGKALPLRDFFLQKLPSFGTGRVRIPFVIAAVAVAVILISIASPAWNLAFTTTLSTAVVLISIVVVTGYAGQISLAQFALAGFGAWVAGRLVAGAGWSFVPAAAVGIAAAIPLGTLFALPAVRSRGIQLAVVTLGLGSAVELMIFNNPDLVGGFSGTVVGEPKLFGLNLGQVAHPARYSLFCLTCFVLIALTVAAMRRGRVGRRLIAVRSNERAATALGISVVEAKFYSFALGAAIAAVGGILIAFQLFVITYSTSFTSFQSIDAVAWTFIGGIGYLAGPLIGATFAPGSVGAEILNQVLSGASEYLQLIGGAVLILLVLQNQDGIARESLLQMRWLAERVARRIPRRAAPSPARTGKSALAGREIEQVRVRPATLEARGLSVSFGPVKAVDNLDLAVGSGEIVGLIGPNGAGKTTVIDALSGFVSPAKGKISLDGDDITRASPTARARVGLSRSFQSLELFEDTTVLDNLRAAFEPRDRRAYLTDLVYPRNPPIPAPVVAAIRDFDLEDDLLREVSDLPYGRRRLVAIARAVATSPSVLLLDEPAAGLSEIESRELATLVKALAKKWGMGVLVIEHDMSFVMGISDRVIVLDYGRKICEGPPELVRDDDDVIAVYLGEDEVLIGAG